ncbi:hypothetical protein D9613_011088 [Agrocybe pediades]|uniref:Uncharacterized protein n=1 Tax=Agrocybe pediades TaxID=84607 RepID=A0A8H4VKJ3_9AGAR|nr:hypothetical protein D9613_011088 [Agrocybe pediades]
MTRGDTFDFGSDSVIAVEQATQMAEIIIQVDSNDAMDPEEKRTILANLFGNWLEVYERAQRALKAEGTPV